MTDNESPGWADITGDGKPELICQTNGQFGYCTPDPSDPTKPWNFHAVSDKTGRARFTHGLGVGDVNGDGRIDLLESNGWWEQPADPSQTPWPQHKVAFAPAAAQMHVYDVNHDGRPDVITALHAHQYGLAWYEQLANGEFKSHLIMGERGKTSLADRLQSAACRGIG